MTDSKNQRKQSAQTTDEDDLFISKSQRKREALVVFELAKLLVNLSPARLSKLTLEEKLHTQLLKTRGIRAHVARKRETQYLAKLIRDQDFAAQIEQMLEEPARKPGLEKADDPLIDQWTDYLLADGDAGLSRLLESCPGGDRQHLRQLIRNAAKSDSQKKRLKSALIELDKLQSLPPP